MLEMYSRARHDMRGCNCGGMFVDGGFDYLRVGGKNLSAIKHRVRYVNATRQELLEDWARMKDKFGLIWHVK